MKAIAFSLHAQQPILATSFQGDPNSDVSYSYIPGSMIRGALIGRYMKQHHIWELDRKLVGRKPLTSSYGVSPKANLFARKLV